MLHRKLQSKDLLKCALKNILELIGFKIMNREKV